MGDRERAARIVKNIRHAERKLRRKFKFLKYQNSLGAVSVLGSAAGICASAAFYVNGHLPWWAVVPACAFFASILHEVEHDLIHDLYFKTSPRIQTLLYWIIWVFRPNTISPWARKPLHLLHHRVSGSKRDIEERLITNGMKFNALRFFSLLDGALNVVIRRKEIATIPGMSALNLRKAGRPMVHLFYGSVAIEAGLIVWGVEGTFRSSMDALMAVWVLPNVLRQFCLVFLSSFMHYFGGVNSVFRQTQVLNAWYFFPLQLFCFHFGATHGIHHFVVNQPYYLREMVRTRAHAVFRRTGLHFNDMGSFRRANRYASINGI